MWNDNYQPIFRQPYQQNQYGVPQSQRPGYSAYNMMYGQPQAQTSNLQWIRVSGPQGAREVSVPPGGEAWIMDENRPVFYHKTADQIGQVATRAYRFEEVPVDGEVSATSIDTSKLATQDDIKQIHDRLAKYDEIIGQLGGAING